MSLLRQPNLVSTIIPVFNRAELVTEAIDSVLAQTHRPIEILVVDDGSVDETPQVLAKLASKHQEIRVFTQPNAGPGAARELGRLNAKGEFIQYLDSDDLLLPRKFEQQIDALKDAPDAVAAYGKTEVITIGKSPQQRAARETASKHKSLFPNLIRSRWWFTSTPLFRKSEADKAGPWSTLTNEEDWEYECRVALCGGTLAYVDKFVSLHRRHADHLSDGGSDDADKLSQRAMARAKIFQHGKAYMQIDDRPSDIDDSDWEFFSKYAFLLARQCALAGLTTEARAMVSVSIDALGKKTLQHRVFLKLVKLFGWRRAARLIEKTGR